MGLTITTPHRKNNSTTKCYTGFRTWTDSRPKRSWEDNIKMKLREIGWGGMDWIHLAQNRYQVSGLVNTVMKLRVP
jgi:hypothetical protein